MGIKLRALISVVLLLALLLVACRPALTPTQTQTSTPAPGIEYEEPVLSSALKRNCPTTQSSGSNKFDSTGLKVGEKAVNFKLRDIYGTEFRLSELLVEKPVMMVFGSFT